jgi:hypothetical protein
MASGALAQPASHDAAINKPVVRSDDAMFKLLS